MKTLLMETPCDLNLESMDHALSLLGDNPIAGTVLLCSESMRDWCRKMWDARGAASPTVSYVPDELLKSKSSWALRGYHAQVVSLMPD